MNLNPLKRRESNGTLSKLDRRAFIVEIRALIALAIIVTIIIKKNSMKLHKSPGS